MIVEVRDLETRIPDQDTYSVLYAWRLELQNKSRHSARVAATIEFQDADGFVVTFDYDGDLQLGPSETKTLTGVMMRNAEKITHAVAKIRVRPS